MTDARGVRSRKAHTAARRFSDSKWSRAAQRGEVHMNTATSRAVMLCGTEEKEPAARLLRAGPLSVEFENGALRYVRFNGTEVLRGIMYLVRDENWATYTPAISDLAVEEGREHFSASYRAVCEDARQRLTYETAISGASDGRLVFEVTAEPETDVLTNRAGFVVLHPAALAGRPVRVTHVDGHRVTARFPELISPGQPLFDIRALDHEVGPGAWTSVRMEGDGFEMEDQRNWSDASYKTYVGSLLKPWPYTLAKGSRNTQSVRLSIEDAGSLAPSEVDDEAPVRVAVGGETGGRLPAAGIGVPAEEAEHAVAAIDLVRRLGPRLLICRLDMRGDVQAFTLEAYRRLGEATGAEVGLEIVIPDGADPAAMFRRIAAALAETGLKPAALSVSTAAGSRILAARSGPAHRTHAGSHLRGGAKGFSGGADRRRHVLLFHRVEPQAPAGRTLRLYRPHYVPDRARRRRSFRHGDAGDPPVDHRLDQSLHRRTALSDRTERDRLSG